MGESSYRTRSIGWRDLLLDGSGVETLVDDSCRIVDFTRRLPAPANARLDGVINGKPLYSGCMVEAQSDAVADLQALMSTARRTVGQLQDAIRAYGVVLEMLENGSTVHDALVAGDVYGKRQAVTAAIAELETARRASRVSLMRADIADGASLKSVSETWGISRQLVHRHLQPQTE